MDRELDKEKLALRSSETFIQCQESQFTIFSIGAEPAPFRPKSREEKATIEITKKLKALRTKCVCPDIHTNFQQLER
jgi:hypothetical protein